ncbi:hypothetical protein [Ralstonia solanacearum species complex bacterium KE056]|uniref:hypothetical protein n=1 Tax=Ralstonia solanacearum species complex bacterium KE056 TaxID=3119585 RepID=UPI002FC3307C
MKWIIRDGNISPIARNTLVVVGLAIIFLGVKFFSGWIAYTCAAIGLTVGAIGAYSGRAALFGLHPFGESEWRKAKRTYKNDDK